MNKWLKKSIITLVSVVTFGVVNPSHTIWSEHLSTLDRTPNRQQTSDQNREDDIRNIPTLDIIGEEPEDLKQRFISEMMEKAETQATIKFGPKIANVIGDEFKQVILPNIEQAIASMAMQFPDEELTHLAITESPSAGFGEKIFHIYNQASNKDIMRFHVRRDKPPLEGYTFNFHYHTHHDQFQTHYTLGTIYWDKNTPPKWQTC